MVDQWRTFPISLSPHQGMSLLLADTPEARPLRHRCGQGAHQQARAHTQLTRTVAPTPIRQRVAIVVAARSHPCMNSPRHGGRW